MNCAARNVQLNWITRLAWVHTSTLDGRYATDYSTARSFFLLVREKITETEPNADGLLAKLADSQLQASERV